MLNFAPPQHTSFIQKWCEENGYSSEKPEKNFKKMPSVFISKIMRKTPKRNGGGQTTMNLGLQNSAKVEEGVEEATVQRSV